MKPKEEKRKFYQERAAARIKQAAIVLKMEGEYAVRDLLADLRHYCDANNLDFAEEDDIAHRNYQDERADDIAGFCEEDEE